MSYYDDAKIAIESRFNTNWDSTNDGPIDWDNVRFDSPSTAGSGASSWVRLTVIPTTAPTVSLGPTNRYRHMGLITVQIFVPEGQGAGGAWNLAEKVQAIFRGQTFTASGGENIVCHGSHLVNIGNTEDGWYQLNVDTEFYMDGTN